MKKKVALTDFSIDSLPDTRKKQFFDLSKHHFGTFFSLGLILAFFAIPFFACISIKYFIIGNAESLYADNPEGYQAFCNTSIIYFDAFYILAFVALAIGFAGFYRIFRKLSWGEGIFFFHDFGVGIKQNSLKFILIAVFFGILHLCSDFVKLGGNTFLNYLPFAFEIILTPFLLMFFALVSIFNERFFKTVANSIIMVFKRLLFSLLFCLFSAAISFIPMIAYPIVQIGLYMVIFVLVIPFFLYCSYQFCLSEIDQFSNKTHNPKYYLKGLRQGYQNEQNI